MIFQVFLHWLIHQKINCVHRYRSRQNDTKSAEKTHDRKSARMKHLRIRLPALNFCFYRIKRVRVNPIGDTCQRPCCQVMTNRCLRSLGGAVEKNPFIWCIVDVTTRHISCCNGEVSTVQFLDSFFLEEKVPQSVKWSSIFAILLSLLVYLGVFDGTVERTNHKTDSKPCNANVGNRELVILSYSQIFPAKSFDVLVNTKLHGNGCPNSHKHAGTPSVESSNSVIVINLFETFNNCLFGFRGLNVCFDKIERLTYNQLTATRTKPGNKINERNETHRMKGSSNKRILIQIWYRV